jgi:hypothetical protein
MKSVQKFNILNFILFQIGYFVAIVCAAHDVRLWPSVYTGLALAWHFHTVRTDWRRELTFFAAALPLGLATDLLLAHTDVYHFQNGFQYFHGLPEWLLCLWLLFLTCFRYSLSWLRDSFFLAMILGGIGAPLSYIYGGEKWGVIIRAMHPMSSAVWMALSWALVIPLLVWINKKVIPNQS